MHIPDGLLTTPVWGTLAAASVGATALATRQAKRVLDERSIPLMGVMGAFVFAAQMVNFPVPGGTSGHLMGGALLAILLGPWVASLTMVAVVIVQAVLFQDGGLTALGANIFNMALIGPLVGYGVHRGFLGLWSGKGSLYLSAALAGFCAVLVGAVCAAVQIALSGRAPFWTVTGAMAAVHALIGIGEGLITAATIRFVVGIRPDLVPAVCLQAGPGTDR